MKLNIIFNENKEEKIFYDVDEVIINAKSRSSIERLLVDDSLKKENLEYRTISLEYLNIYDIAEEREYTLKSITLIEKALEKSFKINSFNSYKINFEEIDNLIDYQNFLENLNGELLIDTSAFSKKHINQLKNISFKTEPQISYKLNTNIVSLTEFIETMEIIAEIETLISRFSLSEVEQQLLLYDLIRERVFKYGKENDYSSSRDLSKVLKEEEIVCAGYSNIFAAVSNHLGIPTFVKTYISNKNESVGHATNISYVYDSIYDKSFILEFDPTWNSKQSNKDTDWINNYNFFGQSEPLATLIKDQKGYKVYNSLTENLNRIYNRYLLLLEHNSIDYTLNQVISQFAKEAIQIFKYLNEQDKVESLKLFLEELDSNSTIDPKFMKDLYNQIRHKNNESIPIKDFLKMLYRVRRIEHSLDFEKYPLDFKLIEQIISKKYSNDKLLLKLLSTREQIENLEVLNYIPSDIKNKINYDIGMMKLLYQLRTIKATKEQEKCLTTK